MMKRHTEAEEDFNFVLEKEPENVKAHFYLGKLSIKKNLDNESVIHFE